MTPKAVTTEEGKVEEQVEEKEAANKTEEVEEKVEEAADQEKGQEEDAASDEVTDAEEKLAVEQFIAHSWVSNWRTNLQGLIWLGNAYVEEH